MNFIADDQMLRDLTLWSMGSLAGANWSGIGLAAVTLIILMFWFQRKAMSLNALLLGESEAKHLGVPVQKLKRQLILLSAVGVGITVSICGAIGFIGLVIPHLGRMLAVQTIARCCLFQRLWAHYFLPLLICLHELLLHPQSCL